MFGRVLNTPLSCTTLQETGNEWSTLSSAKEISKQILQSKKSTKIYMQNETFLTFPWQGGSKQSEHFYKIILN